MEYQGINTFLRKTFLSPLPFFVPWEHRWGNHMYGERYGVTMFTMVTNLNITVLEVPKLQKKYPEMANYATLCRSVL